MPKPRIGNDKLLQVKINPNDFDALQKVAQSQGTTVSEIIRRQVRSLLAVGSSFINPAA